MAAAKLLAITLIILSASCARRTPNHSPSARWTEGRAVGKLDLLGVTFADGQTGWAVGDIAPSGEGGAVYKTTDGGSSWRAIARTTEILTSVKFISPTTGWVAGYAGRIQRTDDGGITWKSQRSEREGEVLNSIFFLDERKGWVAGGAGLVLQTTNGGESWTQTVTGRVEDLWAIRLLSASKGWAVGDDGLILATTDGGGSWVQQTSGTHRALLGLAVSSSGTVIAVGEDGVILRTDDGNRWKAVESQSRETFNAASASEPESFWVVGSRGVILGSTDGGQSWTESVGGPSNDLTSVEVTTTGGGAAVGKQGATRVIGH